MSNICRCQCGFEWQRGQRDGHNCSVFYMANITRLEAQIELHNKTLNTVMMGAEYHEAWTLLALQKMIECWPGGAIKNNLKAQGIRESVEETRTGLDAGVEPWLCRVKELLAYADKLEAGK